MVEEQRPEKSPMRKTDIERLPHRHRLRTDKKKSSDFAPFLEYWGPILGKKTLHHISGNVDRSEGENGDDGGLRHDVGIP